MYIETKQQYSQFEGDELTDLLGQMTFQINNFGLWQSDHDTKASYISDDIEIVYYREGGSTTIIGDRQYECPEGSFLILEPFQLNTSINHGCDHYAYYYFHFDIEPLYLKPQFLSLLTDHGHLIYPDEVIDFQVMLERLLIEAKEKEIGYSSVITSALMRIIVAIIRAQMKRGSDLHYKIHQSSYTSLMNESIHYIQDHLYEPIRLQVMAQSLGVSTSVLYKAFMQILQVPPATYIQQQKIAYVQKQLLLGKNVNILAQELGYSSAYHLSKAFKKITGMSPRDYKKKMILNKNFVK